MISFTYDADTPNAVQSVISHAYASQALIRVYYGDAVTGRDCLEEHDTIGRIRSSCSRYNKPMLFRDEHSIFGSCILTALVVKIVCVSTGRVLYQHPQYHIDSLYARPSLSHAPCYEVLNASSNNELLMRFNHAAESMQWLKFMYGMSNTKHKGLHK